MDIEDVTDAWDGAVMAIDKKVQEKAREEGVMSQMYAFNEFDLSTPLRETRSLRRLNGIREDG